MGSDKPSLRKRRVLVVEDDEDSREFIRTVVEKEECECVTARTASDALRLCDTGVFDMIVLDLVLPDGFGLSVARHITKLGTKTAIVVVSAYLERLDPATYPMFGIKRLIRKPFKVEEIRKALAEEPPPPAAN